MVLAGTLVSECGRPDTPGKSTGQDSRGARMKRFEAWSKVKLRMKL
jgi:hypothetical protein